MVSAGGEDSKKYRCEISELSEEEIVAKIMWAEEVGMELPNKIYLFQGLPKMRQDGTDYSKSSGIGRI